MNQVPTNSDLILPRGNPTAATVVISSEAYLGLVRSVRISMPSETAGALIGSAWQRDDGHPVIEVTDTISVGLAQSEQGLVPKKDQWENLKSWLAANYQPPTRIVGWYYTYADAELPGPQPDSAEQFMYIPHLELLLLVSPADNQGAFYIWTKDRFVPTGGFYEALPHKGARPIIPWDGHISGLGTELMADGTPGEQAVDTEVAWQPQEGQTFAEASGAAPLVAQPELPAAQDEILDTTAAPELAQQEVPSQPRPPGSPPSQPAPPVIGPTNRLVVPAYPEIPDPIVAAYSGDEDDMVWHSPPRKRQAGQQKSSRRKTLLFVVLAVLLLVAIGLAAWQISRLAAIQLGASHGLPQGITLQSLEAPDMSTAKTVLTSGTLTNRLALEDTNFAGGFLTSDYRYSGLSPRLSYGTGTPYSILDGGGIHSPQT